MDAERRAWLQQVAEAARTQADRLRELDGNPHGSALIDDLDRLWHTLTAELRATQAD